MAGHKSENFEFGLDIFNLGRTYVVCMDLHATYVQHKIHGKTITSYIINQQFVIKSPYPMYTLLLHTSDHNIHTSVTM